MLEGKIQISLDLLVGTALLIHIPVHLILNSRNKPNIKEFKEEIIPKSPLKILISANNLILLIAYINFIYKTFFAKEFLTWEKIVFKIISIIIYFSGIALRYWCFRALGKLFVYKLAVFKDHKLIKDGPYKYLVHPSFTGLFMALSAIHFYYVNSLTITLIGLAIPSLSIYFWSKQEEDLLSKHFKDEWKDYIDKRKRFVPGLI